MLSTRNLGTEHSISLRSAAEIRTGILLLSTLAALALSVLTTPAQASGSLSLGTIAIHTLPEVCDPVNGWYYYSNGGTNTYLNCHTATVTCSGTENLGLTFGYLNPVGIVPNVTQALGTIVMHNGDGGVTPGSFAFADSYFKAGYEVVELAWDDDWEMTYDPFGSNIANIQAAACRPATFFNYVYTTLFPSVLSNNATAGMCAQGASAGSAAIAYALAYYGAGSYLDNVELISGPVLSDIKQGCEEGPAGSPVTVCGLTNYNGGQYGCQLGTGGSTWTLSPTYIAGAEIGVRKWTNDSSCAAGTSTSSASNAAWLAQSIVDQGTGATPTFTYSSTAMSGWLCRSVKNTSGYNCTLNNNNNSNYCPNNSSPQGQIFYANIGAGNSPPNYAVYAVDQCVNAEGAGAGNVPGFDPAYFNGAITGANAITYDMIGYAPAQLARQCVHRSH